MLKINNHSNHILKDITLTCDNKDIIILGDNGAGKTTLAKTLCGVIKSEDVIIDGKNINDISYDDRIKLINYIPPKLEIFDDYINVVEYLELNGRFDTSRYTKDEYKKIDNTLQTLSLEYLKTSSCKQLSSGESQLLLIASAIVHNAKYTILDEPTSNLDPKKIKKVFHILKSKEILQNKIIITHNLNLAYKLGFDIVFIKDGTINFRGTNSEFFTTSNLDNFYHGCVKKIDENIVVDI